MLTIPDVVRNVTDGYEIFADQIAASLGLDDADARIAWQYGQQTSKGEQGVVIRIEAI